MPATATEIVFTEIKTAQADVLAIVKELLESLGNHDHLSDINDDAFR